MKYRHFGPLGRDLSQLVLGTMHFREEAMDWPITLLDEWAMLGGNILDCAHNYGEGSSERAVGRWLHESGQFGKMSLLTKGAHPDELGQRVTPEAITEDLYESLDRLQAETVELYLLHRDDPDVPVGPLLETLNHHRDEGRIQAFGASNWTTERLEEAQTHAATHGLQGFTCSSPNLSLAQQSEPPWPGCVSASTRDQRGWYAINQLPVFAWSSQASGFFTGRELQGPMARVYRSSENDARLSRARQLGKRKGVPAHHIALAWVLHQPFPTYAVIGPACIAEMHDSIAALSVTLDEEEVAWLVREPDDDATMIGTP